MKVKGWGKRGVKREEDVGICISKPTAQLVLARIIASPTATDADNRRGLGPDGVYPLKPGRGDRARRRAGPLVLVLNDAGTASEWDADWHFRFSKRQKGRDAPKGIE